MKKFGELVCKNKNLVVIISLILLVFSVVGMKLTKVNYDILVYLPEDIETIKGQKVLTDDFNMGSYSIALVENMNSKEILELENEIKNVNGVNKVVSIYDAIGTSIPLEMLPTEVTEKLHKENTDILFITFAGSTSSEETINAVKEIRTITGGKMQQGGMSSMVLDTMNLSESEIAIYIVIAVILCIIVLECSLDSYVVPFILLANIGVSILFNLGTNIFLGSISYITKALVAVLQLGVTTDFSIFLYHSYENKKNQYKTREEAMIKAIEETFTSVTGSSLTTIAGFLVLCTMNLTLGKDLGIVMAKGVLLGVVTVLTLFPSLLLIFDKIIDKTKHISLIPSFNKLNSFIIKNHIAIFILFLLLIIPMYRANNKVDVYYKLDKSLPATLESIKTNTTLKEDYNIVSPEIILVSKDVKNDELVSMINELESIDGIDFVMSFAKIKSYGVTEEMLSTDLVNIFENDKYQMILVNSLFDIATDELNDQTVKLNNTVKKYDKSAIVAGEGPLMKDLVEISNTDFNNVNTSSIVCIFIILFFVLKSLSLPFLLIASIEFAIFTNMGFSYFNSSILPFIAPIVLGTIQLGATIDYAILLTTTYLTNRKEGLDKESAMLKTMNYSGTSILISSMCFFAATCGVGLYSKIEMIGSLCTLISRGALISMLVVVMVLPSILLLFDKIIIKTTLDKERKINMKKNIKKLAVWTIVLSLGITSMPLPALALTKNETVYTKLNSDGSVKSILVNERLQNNNELESLEDYSELKDILNVGNNNKYEISNNLIKWDAKGGDIFYQGKTDKTLPIKTEIKYYLDGKEMLLDDILGKKGNAKIVIKYINADAHTVLVNGSYEYLYTPFVVAMGTVMDDEYNKNITVDNGRVINTGIKSVIAGISAPGLYESLELSELYGLDTITISFTTTKFELPTIYSVITPKILESSDLSMFNKMDNIYSQVDELQKNMDKIDEGAKRLKDGSNELKTGLSNSINGLKKDDANALTEEQVNAITAQTVESVKSKFTDEYKASIAEKTWNTVKENMNPNDEKVVGIVTENVTNEVTSAVTELMKDYLSTDNGKTIYISCETGKAVMKQGGEMSEEQTKSCEELSLIQNMFTKAIKGAVTNSNKKTASEIASYVAESTSKSVAVIISEQASLSTAEQVAASVAPQVGNAVKNASLEKITTSLETLYSGVEQIDGGINELSDGITKYNKEGINKISSLVNANLKTNTERVRALTNLSRNYTSFGSKLDGIEGETKFILVVDSKSTKEETKKTNNTVEKTTFWTRIKNLFK